VVDRVAKENPGLTRLTVHCTPANATGPIACASTSAEKKGKPSDPEDKQAMATRQTVVLEEAGTLDVTVPILVKDGKCTTACGITLKKDGATREQLMAKANAVARSVEAGLGATCSDCCSNCCSNCCSK
jgi:hypothetical protein